jgi:hypothetical protein
MLVFPLPDYAHKNTQINSSASFFHSTEDPCHPDNVYALSSPTGYRETHRKITVMSVDSISKRAFTEAEAANYLAMSRSFLRQSRMDGIRETRTPCPPFVRVGRAIRYLREDLDAWLEEYRYEPQAIALEEK